MFWAVRAPSARRPSVYSSTGSGAPSVMQAYRRTSGGSTPDDSCSNSFSRTRVSSSSVELVLTSSVVRGFSAIVTHCATSSRRSPRGARLAAKEALGDGTVKLIETSRLDACSNSLGQLLRGPHTQGCRAARSSESEDRMAPWLSPLVRLQTPTGAFADRRRTLRCRGRATRALPPGRSARRSASRSTGARCIDARPTHGEVFPHRQTVGEDGDASWHVDEVLWPERDLGTTCCRSSLASRT